MGVEKGSKRIKPMVDKRALGDEIARLLDAKGYTQSYLAEMVGTNDTQISRWVRGEYLPTDKNLQRISLALGESYDRLYNIARPVQVTAVTHPPALQLCIDILNEYGARIDNEDLKLLSLIINFMTANKRRKRR